MRSEAVEERQERERPFAWVNVPALLAVLIWGAMVAFNKYALIEFPVMTFVVLRALAAAAVMFLFARWRGMPLGIERGDWRRLVAAGCLGQGFFQAFTIGGLRYTTATHNILLFSTTPIVGALLLWLFRGQRASARGLLGIVIGFAGILLLVLGGESAEAGGGSLFGDTLTMVGTLGWVALTVLPAPLTRRYGALLVTAWLQLLAGLLLLPLALGDVGQMFERPPGLLPWLAFLYGAVFGTVVGFTLWQRAVQQIGAAGTMVYAYIEPLATILIAWLLLGERMGPVQALGAVVLLAGVALAQRA